MTKPEDQQPARVYPQGTDPRIRQKLRRRWKWAILGLVVLAAGIGVPGMAWKMIRTTPAGYAAYRQQLRNQTPEQTQRIAQAVQDGILGLTDELAQGLAGHEALPLPAPGQTAANPAEVITAGLGAPKVEDLGKDEQGRALRRIHLDNQQVNAWLAMNHRDWLAYRDYHMPPEVRDPMVSIADGQMRLFFTYESEVYTQTFNSGFKLDLASDGMATLTLRDMRAGNLPMPIDRLGSAIQQASGHGSAGQDAAQWLDKLQQVTFKPAFKLPDGLKGQVIDYQLADDGITLTVRVERYRAASPKKPIVVAVSQDENNP